MCKITIQGAKGQFSVDLQAQGDWLSCLMTGVMAALPAFLDAFMKCLSTGNGGTADYNPGDRNRC